MNHRLVILGLHVTIFLALMFGYEQYIVPIYGYEGYVFQPNEANWYIAFASVIVLSLVTPIASQKPSTSFYQLILTVVLLPMMVLFYAEDKPREYVAQVLAAYLLAVVLPLFLKITPPKFFLMPKDKLRGVLFSISSFYIATIFLMGGGAYLNFDISKVYDFRDQAARNLPGMYGYISPLIGKVVLPIAFVLSLLHKKYLMASMLLCSSVLIFGLTAHKSTLFAPFLVLFIYIVSTSKDLSFKLNAGILIVVLIALADFWLSQNYDNDLFGWGGALMMGRSFFLAAEINYMYYDFFSRNDWVWFSDSKVTLGLMDYKYPLDVANLIGRDYFNDERTSANTGWFGSGYMQAGLIGLLLYAAIIAIVFNYVDACARNSGERGLVTAAAVAPIFTFVTSADLPTTFLTHGLYLNLLLIACFQGGESSNVYSPAKQRIAV